MEKKNRENDEEADKSKKDQKENDEEAYESKKDCSPEDDGSDGTQKTEEQAPDPTDSFNSKEDDMTGVQESSGQRRTTKALDESGEVETAETSRFTKESDKLAEGDNTEQLIKDNFEKKKDGEDDEDEGSGKKPMLRANKWLSWWKKRWPASSDLQSKVQKDKEKNHKTEPDKNSDEVDKNAYKTCVGEQGSKNKGQGAVRGATYVSHHKVQV